MEVNYKYTCKVVCVVGGDMELSGQWERNMIRKAFLLRKTRRLRDDRHQPCSSLQVQPTLLTLPALPGVPAPPHCKSATELSTG